MSELKYSSPTKPTRVFSFYGSVTKTDPHISHFYAVSDDALAYPPLLIKEVLKCEHHDALVSLVIATNHRVSLARAGAPIREYGCVESVENSLLSTEALIDYDYG